MDLYQHKLSKLEWESIEIPVTKEEKKIVKFIKESYGNVNNKYNDNLSLLISKLFILMGLRNSVFIAEITIILVNKWFFRLNF